MFGCGCARLTKARARVRRAARSLTHSRVRSSLPACRAVTLPVQARSGAVTCGWRVWSQPWRVRGLGRRVGPGGLDVAGREVKQMGPHRYGVVREALLLSLLPHTAAVSWS